MVCGLSISGRMSAPLMMDELIGKELGGYEILERIGKGGMATVYRARQITMNRDVAIKVLPREQMKDDSYLLRFEREVNIVARLEHRNIVPVYDHGSYDGQPYIIMRYMSAGSVDDILRNGPLEPEQYVDIIEQIAPALDYAHTKNVIHRDLKPSNVLLDDDGGAYITDFGIARILSSDGGGNTITTQGVVGTPSYMSPEQAQGLALDGRSDVYSLGVMLFEMATGRRPFISETPYTIAVMQVTTPPPSARSLNPKVSISVEQVIYKALKKKPDERYQTAQELSEALRMAVEKGPIDFSTHETERPARRSASLMETQPHHAQSYNTPMPASPASSPPYQPPVPLPPQVVHPQPVPSGLYPPPTPPKSVPVSKRVQSRIKKRGGNMWVSIFIGALIGCGLLTLVVLGIALLADNFLNSASAADGRITTRSEARETDRGVIAEDSVGEVTPEQRTAVSMRASYSTSQGSLIYFSEQDANFEIYRHSLSDGKVWQLTSDSSTNLYPSPSPDGIRVVFQSDRDGDFDLYAMNPTGGALVKLLNTPVNEMMPSWSPDGEWIVFASDVRSDGAYDLFKMRYDGSDVQRILTNERRNSYPRWSPDGDAILFTSGQPFDARTWEIALLDLETMRVRSLTDNDVRDAWGVFSPDGEHILYITGADGATQLVRLPVSGEGSPEVVVEAEEGEYLWNPQYSPDGAYITFNAGRVEDAVGNLYTIRADGTERRPVKVEGGIFASWLP
jgi:serine/threonine protein kinase